MLTWTDEPQPTTASVRVQRPSGSQDGGWVKGPGPATASVARSSSSSGPSREESRAVDPSALTRTPGWRGLPAVLASAVS